MRIDLRIAEFRCDSVFELLRYEMLQALRFFVNFVPSVVQEVVQKPFQETVMRRISRARFLPAAVSRAP